MLASDVSGGMMEPTNEEELERLRRVLPGDSPWRSLIALVDVRTQERDEARVEAQRLQDQRDALARARELDTHEKERAIQLRCSAEADLQKLQQELDSIHKEVEAFRTLAEASAENEPPADTRPRKKGR